MKKEEVLNECTSQAISGRKLRFFIEELKGNVKIPEICRREEIWPREYYRIKEKSLCRALEALENSRRRKDAEKQRLKKEIERLRNIVLSRVEEIDFLKKRPIGIIRAYLWLQIRRSS